MLTEQHIEEGLGRAYIMAISNSAGLTCEFPISDFGIDGTICNISKSDDGRRFHDSYKIDFQLKSSINVELKDDVIKYALEAKNYNDLINTNVGMPRILILFKLPQDRNTWLSVNEEEMILKNCSWWCSLAGREPTPNTSTKTIDIPRSQILTPEALRTLMDCVIRGETF